MATNSTDLPLYFGWSPLLWGYFSSAVAAFFLGSYGVPLKVGVMKKMKPDPMVVHIFISIAIFGSSWLILIFVNTVPFKFTPLGIISASLWLTSIIFSIIGKNTIGMGVTQGISSASTIIISFLWGHLIFQEPIDDLALSVLGIVFVVAGIAGITLSSSDLLEKFFSIDATDYTFSESEIERLNPDRRRTTTSSKNNNTYNMLMKLRSEKSVGSQTLIGTTCALLQG